MANLIELFRLMLMCGTLLTIAFFVLLAMPNSQLRSFLMPIISWGMAIFCGIYVISPVDIMPEAILGPFGLADDLGAVVMGIVAARKAMSTSRD